MASTKLINSSRLISIILCVTSLVWDQSLGLVDDKMKTVPCAPERDAAIEDQLDIPHLEKAENATSIIGETQFCENNMAGGYECSKIDLEAYLCLGDLGGPGILGGVSGAGGGANDIWGWTSPDTGIEYAIVGLRTGTDISTPTNPILLGMLKVHAARSNWLDMKTYKNHVFVVTESPLQGIQVYDLTQLDSMDRTSQPDMRLRESAHFNSVGSAHNIAINEETGFAYVLGSKLCFFGLYMVDISDPLEPKFAGCFREDGYVHDAQCVLYDGPDERYKGKEICFCCNEDSVTIVDVTDKSNPSCISKLTYPYSGMTYTHQGWLSEDSHFFIFDDETDVGKTKTYVMDVMDLENPFIKSKFCQPFVSPDHNQYVKGNYTFQANYRAGLRILDFEQMYEPDGVLEEVAFFDIYKENNFIGMNGAWSNYPWFKSGVVIVSGIEQGLFVLRPHMNYNASVSVRDMEAEIIQDGTINKDIRSEHVRVTITVNDYMNLPAKNANVTGYFYSGIKKTSCITDETGKCTIVSDTLQGGIYEIQFNVHDIMMRKHRYDKHENAVSSITMTKSDAGFQTRKQKNIPREGKQHTSMLWAIPTLVAKLMRNVSPLETF